MLKIIIEGGCLREVLNLETKEILTEGKDYILEDLDNEEKK